MEREVTSRPAEDEPLRWGILGAARITPPALVEPARLLGNRLVAVAARDRKRAAAFARVHGVENVVDSYAAVIGSPDVDAIYNPLPNGLHGYWSLETIRAGKHLLCEKPFAANGDEAAAVARSSQTADTVVMEAFHYFYHPVAQRMQELASSGELGDLTHVELIFGIPAPVAEDPRWSLHLAGGATMDLGCYCLHVLRSLAPLVGGAPTLLAARAVVRRGLPEVDEQMEAELRFPSGVTGSMRCSMDHGRREATYRLVGSRGEAVAAEFVEPHLDDTIVVRTAGGVRTERMGRRATYAYQLEEFLGAVRDGEPVATDTDDAVANMRLIDECYVAAGLQPRQPTTPRDGS